MNPSTHRHINLILVLALYVILVVPDLALSSQKAVSTSKAVFYVY